MSARDTSPPDAGGSRAGGDARPNDSHADTDRTIVKELFGLMLEAAEESEQSSGGGEIRAEAQAAMEKTDAKIRQAVERLLAAHGRAKDVLLEATADAVRDCSAEPSSATGVIADDPPCISGYEIGEEIGRGGFGVVYRAWQRHPVERPVAIKVLRMELATQDVIARFRAESRVLARMSHAGIARVLDTGLDAQQRPFVTMELIDGLPLVAHCEMHALPVRDRVRLMIDVCNAVHHAHQRAVVHRDLKPANILVERIDDRHQPRVIDFGIAKILEENADESRTQAGSRLGTPRYMSPEQATGGDGADVRSDVYALGVLLCEALTNQVPRDPVGPDETSGSRSKTRATRPSRLAAAADEPEVALRSRELRGDLDRIVLKAVALDPDQRYDSAAALADDLRRYLDGLPVQATTPSVIYLTRKFIARRKLTSAATLLAVFSLVGGTAAAMYGMARANESRIEAEQQTRRAEHEATVATEINEFWIDIIQRSSPQEARRPDLQVREALDLASPHLADRINDPNVRRRLHETFANAYHALGLSEPQLHHARLARSLLDEAPAVDPAESIQVLRTLASALLEAHELAEARIVLDAAIERCKAHGETTSRQLPYLLQTLARVADRDGDFSQAEHIYLNAVEQSHEILGPRHLTTLANERGLALTLVKLGRAQEAIEQLVAVLAAQEETLGADHPDAIATLTTLAAARQNLGRFEEAERDYAALLERSIVVLGEEHSYILVLRNNLASLLREIRRFEEAEAMFRAIRDAHLRSDGPDHPGTLRATANLATALIDQHKYEECESLLIEVIDGRSRVLGTEHPDTINAKQVLASIYSKTDRLEKSAELYAVLLEQLRRAVPLGNVRLAPLLRNYGIVLEQHGRIEEALRLYIESHEILLNAAGPEHPQTIRGEGFVCDALSELAETSEFPQWRDRCAE